MSTDLKLVSGQARISNSFLEATLHAINIKPIPQERVEQYMDDEIRNALPSTRIGRYLHQRGFSRFPFDNLLKICLRFVCLAGILTFGAGLIYPGWLVVGVILIVGPLVLLAEMTFGNTFLINFARGPAHWEIIPANRSYLPGFAQKMMYRVLEYLPDAEFEVADLKQNSYSLDPILFVMLGDERIAIAVWKFGNPVTLN